MRDEERPEIQERALEALLGGPAERARGGHGADPDAERQEEWLAARMRQAADELRATDRRGIRQEARFVARVLALTTRQDLSWRGDLRLALDFLRARLRASPALRIVAASLALHLIAGPAVAYWVFHERKPTPRPLIHFELPAEKSEDPFAAIPLEGGVGEGELLEAARRAEARENETARSRYVLLERGPRAPVVSLPMGAPLESRLLDRRARLLRMQEEATTTADEGVIEEMEPLALALWVEYELDRLVLLGAESPLLGRACARLVERSSEAAALGQEATAELGRAALGRAARLGRPQEWSWGSSTPDLLGPAWFALLGRAGEERGLALAEPWSAWRAWGQL